MHCHGCFDLLHIGHIRYLQAARALGDVLVVTVTPDRYVNKGPDRPAFPSELRAEHVAALDCVDFAAVNRWASAVETITLLKPDLYIKGNEYVDAAEDPGTAVGKERAAVEAVGGQLAFTDEIVFSSSHLINQHAPQLPEATRKYLEGFTDRYGSHAINEAFHAASKIKLLVVGETILDEYQYCEAIGKSSKEPSLVVRADRNELFAGGIVAVANNAAAACDKVTMLSRLGDRDVQTTEPFVRGILRPEVQAELLVRSDSPTVLKKRYVDNYFFTKLLEVYHINDATPTAGDDQAFCDRLAKLLPEADAVIVVDFGHGLISADAVELLCSESKYLAVNVQANAGNLGYNTLTKYRRADLLCVAQNELRLDARDRTGELAPLLTAAAERLSAGSALVTRGKAGCLAWCADQGMTEIPAVATKVVDRVGAGDTFLSVAAPARAAGAPLEVAAFLGSVAGAEAVATVGHRRYLERSSLLAHAQTLLK